MLKIQNKYINIKYIESMVDEKISSDLSYALTITMISGCQYIFTFDNLNEMNEIITDILRQLNI